MVYDPPDDTAADFELESYESPDQHSVDFVLDEGGVTIGVVAATATAVVGDVGTRISTTVGVTAATATAVVGDVETRFPTTVGVTAARVTASAVEDGLAVESGEVIEAFEDGDLSAYEDDSSEAALAVHEVVDDISWHGSYSLTEGNWEEYRLFNHGIDTQISRGNSYSFRARFESDDEGDVRWFFATEEDAEGEVDGYVAGISQSNGLAYIGRVSGDSFVGIGAGSFDPVMQAWYKLTVDFGEMWNDRLVLTVEDEFGGVVMTQVIVEDEEYDSGGIGWSIFNIEEELEEEGRAYVDYLRHDEPVDAGRIVVEDFERGDLEPYNHPDSHEVVSDDPFRGSYNLRNVEGTTYVMVSGSGLNYYPRRGDYIKFVGRFDDESDDRLMFIFSGPDAADPFSTSPGDDWYGVRVNGAAGELELWIEEDGSLDTYSGSYDRSATEDGRWFEVHIDFGHSTEDDLEAFIYDDTGSELGSVGPVTHDTFSGGDEVGWQLPDRDGEFVDADHVIVDPVDTEPMITEEHIDVSVDPVGMVMSTGDVAVVSRRQRSIDVDGSVGDVRVGDVAVSTVSTVEIGVGVAEAVIETPIDRVNAGFRTDVSVGEASMTARRPETEIVAIEHATIDELAQFDHRDGGVFGGSTFGESSYGGVLRSSFITVTAVDPIVESAVGAIVLSDAATADVEAVIPDRVGDPEAEIGTEPAGVSVAGGAVETRIEKQIDVPSSTVTSDAGAAVIETTIGVVGDVDSAVAVATGVGPEITSAIVATVGSDASSVAGVGVEPAVTGVWNRAVDAGRTFVGVHAQPVFVDGRAPADVEVGVADIDVRVESVEIDTFWQAILSVVRASVSATTYDVEVTTQHRKDVRVPRATASVESIEPATETTTATVVGVPVASESVGVGGVVVAGVEFATVTVGVPILEVGALDAEILRFSRARVFANPTFVEMRAGEVGVLSADDVTVTADASEMLLDAVDPASVTTATATVSADVSDASVAVGDVVVASDRVVTVTSESASIDVEAVRIHNVGIHTLERLNRREITFRTRVRRQPLSLGGEGVEVSVGGSD